MRGCRGCLWEQDCARVVKIFERIKIKAKQAGKDPNEGRTCGITCKELQTQEYYARHNGGGQLRSGYGD